MHGSLFIVSAPSGAGKTSLVAAWLERDSRMALSVSHTTRPIRNGEQDGIDYHFVSKDNFSSMIEQNAFFEYAEVFSNFYGTSSQRVNDQRSRGKDVILEIDWQGAQQIRKLIPDAISIFILPPSKDELAKRLQGRGQDSQETINKRLAGAKEEMEHFSEADYLIINDRFEVATEELLAIARAERARTGRLDSMRAALINDLISD